MRSHHSSTFPHTIGASRGVPCAPWEGMGTTRALATMRNISFEKLPGSYVKRIPS